MQSRFKGCWVNLGLCLRYGHRTHPKPVCLPFLFSVREKNVFSALLSEPTIRLLAWLNCLHGWLHEPSTWLEHKMKTLKPIKPFTFMSIRTIFVFRGLSWDLSGEEGKENPASKSWAWALLPNLVCFAEGFVFMPTVINFCSEAQTTHQVSHLCLLSSCSTSAVHWDRQTVLSP